VLAVTVSQWGVTGQQCLDDGLELAGYLRRRFGQDKIFLVCHSWGTFLGLWMAQREAHRFWAYVGIGQMVAAARLERALRLIMLQAALMECLRARAVVSIVCQCAPAGRGRCLAGCCGSPVLAGWLWWMVAVSHSTAVAAITAVRPAPLAVISICTPAARAARPMSEVMAR
jgi:pimeloyl-ACP methyl ester carboxylesterase